MKKPTFEIQPHYALNMGTREIFDLRFIDGNVPVPDDLQPFVFQATEQELPLEYSKPFFGHKLPSRCTDKDYVNGITVRRFVGSDGEDWSGGIELLDIIVPGKESTAAITAYQFNHKSGLPDVNTSWVAEFAQVKDAINFWDHYWRPHFFIDNVKEVIARFLEHQRAEDKEIQAPRVYPVGILKPWFNQTTNDAIFEDCFASTGNRAVKLRQKDEDISEEFKPGIVYCVPETPYYGNKAESYRVATCLGAISLKDHDWWRGRDIIRTAIQWQDGTLSIYRRDYEGPIPEPLTFADLSYADRRKLAA